MTSLSKLCRFIGEQLCFAQCRRTHLLLDNLHIHPIPISSTKSTVAPPTIFTASRLPYYLNAHQYSSVSNYSRQACLRPFSTSRPRQDSTSNQELTHLNHRGEAQMVLLPPPFPLHNSSSLKTEVGENTNQGQSYKPITTRVATATGTVIFNSLIPYRLLSELPADPSATGDEAERIRKARSKGDVLSTARIAGITAAKATSSLIPLCHNIPLAGVSVDISVIKSDEQTSSYGSVQIRSTVTSHTSTGVEMEALTATTIACLTVYDMLKAVDRGMQISNVRLLEKKGGKSGDWLVDDKGNLCSE